MPASRKIRLKILAVICLLAVAGILYVLYQDTFSREAATKRVHERWAEIQNLKEPEGALELQEVTEGGAHYYGIDCHKLVVLEITGMSRAADLKNAEEQLGAFYAEQLQAWHPELDKIGRSGQDQTVQGRAGLVNIEVASFWYGEAAEQSYQGPGQAVVLQTYQAEEGRGRRFAAVSLIICTRH